MRNAATALAAVVLALASGCSSLEASEHAAEGAAGMEGAVVVANKRGDSLSRIDLATGRDTARVPTCATRTSCRSRPTSATSRSPAIAAPRSRSLRQATSRGSGGSSSARTRGLTGWCGTRAA